MIKKRYRVFNLLAAILMVAALVVTGLPGGVPRAQAAQQTWSSMLTPASPAISVNVGGVGPMAVASDGTIFAVVGSDPNGDGSSADGIGYRVLSSTTGGASWAAQTTPAAFAAANIAAAVVNNIAVSPNFATDGGVFVTTSGTTPPATGTANGGYVYWSNDRGANFTALGATPLIDDDAADWDYVTGGVQAGAGDYAIRSLAVAPNFNGATGGRIAVGLQEADATEFMVVFLDITANWGGVAGVFTPMVDDANAAAGDGVWALAFSPNYASDGVLMAVNQEGGNVQEERSIAGAAFTAGVTLHAGGANLAAAAIAFPSGYNVASADNYFIATADGAGNAASTIFRRVAGLWQAAIAPVAGTDYGSLAVSGEFAAATVFAGHATTATIQKSTTGGLTWLTTPVTLVAGNTGPVYVALPSTYSSDSTIYAGTGALGAQGGFFRSTSGGGTSASWLGVGLHNGNYGQIDDLAVSPNFLSDATALVVMSVAGANPAVFRTTTGRTGTPPGASTSWTKVEAGVNVAATNVSVSPAFATDQTVYIGGGTALAKSTNGGVSFSGAAINAPTYAMIAGQGMVVANASTLFVVAASGRVQRSSDSGQTWTTYSSGLANVDSLVISPSFATDSTVLLGGRTTAGAAVVQISTDGGVTWSAVGTHPDTSAGFAWVAFDSNYASTVTTTAKYAYSGTQATGDVYRWQVDTSTSWRDMDARGFVQNGVPVPTQASTLVSGIASANGVVYATQYDAAAQDSVRRAVYPRATYDGTATTWFNTGWAAEWTPGVGANDASADILNQENLGTELTAGTNFALGGAAGSNALIAVAGTNSNTLLLVDTGAAPDTIVMLDDNLMAGPTLQSPANDSVLTAHPTAARWAAYAGVPGARYQLQLSTDSTFTDPVNTGQVVPAAGALTQNLGATAPALTAASGYTYYWRARALSNATGQSVSPWSETRQYTIAAAPGGILLYPTSAAGLRQEVPTNTPTFSWTNVASATGYEIQIASEGNTTSYSGYPASGNGYVTPLITATVTGNVTWTVPPSTLTEGGVYYWHVRPIYGTTPGAWSFASAAAGASGVFKVAGTPPTPTAIPPTATPVPPTAVPGAATPTPEPTATPAAPVSAATQLATISTNLVLAISYNPSDTADPWKIYDPAAPDFANDLPQLSAGSGYWIYVSAASTLSSGGNTYNLVPGWNLIGWLG